MKKDLIHNLKIAGAIALTLIILCTAVKVFMWSNLPLPTATISDSVDFPDVVTQGYTTTTNLGLRKPNYHQTGWNTHINYDWDLLDSTVGAQATRSSMFVVAASDAGAASILQSDYQCDGTADDVQINAAADAAFAAGGGTVKLSEGDFVISGTIQLQARVYFNGAGLNSTQISLGASADTDMFRHDIESVDVFAGIRDMSLNGQKATNVTGSAVVCNGSSASQMKDLTLENLFIVNFSDTAIETDFCWGWYVDKVVIEFCEDRAIAFTGGTEAFILNCKLAKNYGTAIDLVGASSVVITGNYITMEFSKSVWGESIAPAGINMTSDNNIISNNIIFAKATGSDAVGVRSSGDRNIISDNWFDGSSMGDYAIHLTSATVYTIVTGNMIRDSWDTANIFNEGNWNNTSWDNNDEAGEGRSTYNTGDWTHYVGGSLAFTIDNSKYIMPSFPVVLDNNNYTGAITAAGGVTSTHTSKSYVRISGDGGAIDITANPQIAAGIIIGQVLVLQGISDSNTVLFETGTGLLMAASATLASDHILVFIWDGATWNQISYSAN